jgi:hypothetical protein
VPAVRYERLTSKDLFYFNNGSPAPAGLGVRRSDGGRDSGEGGVAYRGPTLASGTSLSSPYFLTFMYRVLFEIRSCRAAKVRLP